MSRYCNEACQRAKWPTYKAFCRLAVKHGVEPRWRFFDPLENLDAPIPDYAAHRDQPGDFVTTLCCLRARSRSLHLHSLLRRASLRHERDNQLMSYSRGYCARSHERYTVCATHNAENHRGADWRDRATSNRLMPSGATRTSGSGCIQ